MEGCAIKDDRVVQPPRQVIAKYNYAEEKEGCLNFGVDQIFTVLSESSDQTWLYCEAEGLEGWIPSSYVAPLTVDSVDWQDGEYFGQYGTVALHHEMLSDSARNEGYLAGIRHAAPQHIRGRKVMDVGCGSGLLSLMCAREGAEHVFAIEASDFHEHAREVIADNGYSDVISVTHGKIETIICADEASLKSKEVDCIVSEWMGTMLVFEYMIESVLLARDSFLSKNGLMLPSAATLFFAPVTAPDVFEHHITSWNDKCGFDMSRLGRMNMEAKLARPFHDWIMPATAQLAAPAPFPKLDMHTVTVDDLESLEHAADFLIDRTETLHGIGCWFDVEFWASRGDVHEESAVDNGSRVTESEAPGKCSDDRPSNSETGEMSSSTNVPSEIGGSDDDAVVLSTGPKAPLTHWKQDLLVFDEPLAVEKGQSIRIHMRLQRNKHHRRHLHVLVSAEILSQGHLGSQRADIHDTLEPSSRKVSKLFKLWR